MMGQVSALEFFHNLISKQTKYKLTAIKNCNLYTLVKSSRIYKGQYDDNMLGEHKGREKNIVYGRLF